MLGVPATSYVLCGSDDGRGSSMVLEPHKDTTACGQGLSISARASMLDLLTCSQAGPSTRGQTRLRCTTKH